MVLNRLWMWQSWRLWSWTREAAPHLDNQADYETMTDQYAKNQPQARLSRSWIGTACHGEILWEGQPT